MYSIIELQTNDGTTTHNYFTAETLQAAQSKFHEILMYAATSSIEIHACTMLAENGNVMRAEHFEHEATEE